MPLIRDEPATEAFYAIRLGPTEFGIFNAFPDEAGRAAHGAGCPLEPRLAVAVDAVHVLEHDLEPRLIGVAQHGSDLVREVAPAKDRVACHQVAGIVLAQVALDREVGALGVEVLGDLLVQSQERRLLGEQGIGEPAQVLRAHAGLAGCSLGCHV